jgi:formate hydrogenlyase subunit 3/multisubunit Na+/H+ antiporter MnhD subunit
MVTWLPAWVPLAAALVPLVVAAGCVLPASREIARRLVTVAAIPALAAALLVPAGTAELDWLVTGVSTGLDETGRAFLALAAVIWTVAALYAAAQPVERPSRFAGWFSLAMAGNLALCCVTDPAGFYTFFAMMALPTYALVAHAGPPARSAGRAYMVFTVVGEALLVCGLFIVAAGAAGIAAGPALGPLGIALVLAAFGIKIGAVGLHGWMPVSYPAAPPPAAAALAGSRSTAGVLGLLRFLPGGESAAVGFGPVVMAFGVAAAFYGAAVGVMQTEPKTVLAYSSISQFGIVTVVIGAGLAEPAAWLLAVTAATVYAVHHGLAKAALFLGEDVAARSTRRWPAVVALALPALALTGAPLTSGAVAKIVLKEATALAPGGWHDALETILPLAAVGTTLLVARFLYLVATREVPQRDAMPPRLRPLAVVAWGLLLAAVASALWIWPSEEVHYAASKSLTAHYLWLALWPVLAGIALAAVAWAARSVSQRFVGLVPPGDVYSPALTRADRIAERRDERVRTTPPVPAAAPPAPTVEPGLLRWAGGVESGLLLWVTAISAVAALSAVLLMLASFG